MSKYVKNLVSDELKSRLTGVEDAVLVNLEGMKAVANSRLRVELRNKKMHVLVIKNSLARRATEGTPLNAAFVGTEGPTAVVWGADIVTLAREVKRLAAEKSYAPFAGRGGVLGGQKLSADEIKAVSDWPSREELLSIISGQILSPGANLCSQLTSVGGALASQIKQRGEGDEESPAEAPAEAPAG